MGLSGTTAMGNCTTRLRRVVVLQQSAPSSATAIQTEKKLRLVKPCRSSPLKRRLVVVSRAAAHRSKENMGPSTSEFWTALVKSSENNPARRIPLRSTQLVVEPVSKPILNGAGESRRNGKVMDVVAKTEQPDPRLRNPAACPRGDLSGPGFSEVEPLPVIRTLSTSVRGECEQDDVSEKLHLKMERQEMSDLRRDRIWQNEQQRLQHLLQRTPRKGDSKTLPSHRPSMSAASKLQLYRGRQSSVSTKSKTIKKQ